MFEETLSKDFTPKILETFWDLETIGIKDTPYETDDDLALQHFNSTIKFTNNHYQVQWPWKKPTPELPDNFGLSVGRLKSILHRFQSDPDLLKKYDNIIQEQLKNGTIEKVSFESSSLLKHYLPHHPVVTPSKITTKVRIVYDASSKTRKNLNSLNDCLYRGPLLLPDLCGILIRFRLMPIAIISDIEKAFLQFQLQELDRDVTRFLWLKDLNNLKVENNLEVYRFCRVPFGVVSSPFLLNATLRYHLQQQKTETSNKILQNLYVDNVILEAEDVNVGIKMYLESKDIFQKAGMNLTQWTSNSQIFNNTISPNDKANENIIKILGLTWNTETDILTIHIVQKSYKALTKRAVSKSIASTFDPLGLLSPILLKGKLFLQKLWSISLAWDEELPDDL